MRKLIWPALFLSLHLLVGLFIAFKSPSVHFSAIQFLRFAIEGLAAGFFGLALLTAPLRFARLLFYGYLILYIVALVVQIISYNSTLSFLPHIALENTDNARLFYNAWNLGIGALGAAILATCCWLGSRYAEPLTRWTLFTFASSVLCAASLLKTDDAARVHLRSLREKKSLQGMTFAQSDTPPLRALAFSLFDIREASQANLPANFEIKLPNLDFDKPLPFFKPSIYTRSAPFSRVDFSRRKQNVLLIFAEGLSARTIGFYNKKFFDLTPNISRFANEEASLPVLNYFNHTAATFRGLRGQLCSVHPRGVANTAWRDGTLPKLFCLADYFGEEGYQTAFLDPHERTKDHLNEMLSTLGFDQVLTAKEIRGLLGGARQEANGLALSDRDLFRGLFEFLRSPKRGDKPFFVSTYVFGTHAWLDSPSWGLKYRDGSNNALNTIRELDSQFGAFWEKFKSLKIYKDTVVIFTTDHAHFHEDSYVNALAASGIDDYAGFFGDRIPLIIHDPSRRTPKSFDANYASSIHLAPTLAHFMGLTNRPVPFLGTSIFERSGDWDVASFGENYYFFNKSGIFDISASERPEHEAVKGWIRKSRAVIESNRVWTTAGESSKK